VRSTSACACAAGFGALPVGTMMARSAEPSISASSSADGGGRAAWRRHRASSTSLTNHRGDSGYSNGLVSPPKKSPSPAHEERPLTPVRVDGPTNTVIVAEEVDPREVKTAALPSVEDAATPEGPTTQPTPAWPDTPVGSPPTTQPTPAWSDEVAAEAMEDISTRPVARQAPRPDVTAPELVALDSNAHLRGVTTKPSKVPRLALSRSTRVLLLASSGVILLALSYVAATRRAPVMDPSRPTPMAKASPTKPLPKEPVPKPVDATTVPVAPKATPRPPLTMEVQVDAGRGLPPVTTTVPASIVRLETEPMVKVSWNGDDYGLTPVLITMPVGPNVISVENKDLGLKRTMTITASPEERTFLRYEFARGWVSVDRPATATLFVDGAKVKDRTITLWEGRHRLDVTFRNGQKASQVADIVRGETIEVFFEEPLPNE
jgi:hypothetical protein